MELEVCAYSLESCRAAVAGGADRVELCTAMYEGGITPSAGMIKLARELLKDIQLYVMIRPRGGDFLYTEEEFRQMQEDILYIRKMDVDGVVFGILNADGSVDVERTGELVDLASPMKVTFHRAFDMTADYSQALEDIIGCGCARVLTSGQRNTAVEGEDVIRKLVALAGGRIEIMAGSGVNVTNTCDIIGTGVDALHMSGKVRRDSSMVYRNPNVLMGGVPGVPEYEISFSDEAKIREVKRIIEVKNRG